MDIAEVIKLCRSFEAEDLSFWVDGGWAVDALLGEQTRPHSDLDLAVELHDLPAFQGILLAQGYVRTDRPGDPNWNWVFRNTSDRSVDLHGFIRDAHGNGVLGKSTEGSMYPVGALNGVGTLGGFVVQCVAARFILLFRNSFEPRPKDRHDVALLCARFGLPLPSRFRSNDC